MNDFEYLGTELKYLVSIEAAGFDISRDDFQIVLTRGSRTQTFAKSDLVTDGEDYYICFDTTPFGAGELYYTITAYVPDNDFPDGFRTEKFMKRLTSLKSKV